MNIAIKKPQFGERIRSEQLGFVGSVISVIGYNEALKWQTLPERIATNRQLKEELGTEYAKLYFEVEVLIEECTNSGFDIGKTTIITWDEYQHTVIVPLDNPMKH